MDVVKTRGVKFRYVSVFALILVGFSAWVALVSHLGDIGQLFSSYGVFLFLGFLGATVANSTGAGGGVVFVPAFEYLGLHSHNIVATSFAIQCFGMTMGSLSWIQKFRARVELSQHFHDLLRIILIAVPSSFAGLWSVQYGAVAPLSSLMFSFSLFSMVLGIVLLLQLFLLKSDAANREVRSLSLLDRIAFVLVCFVGGAITAWLSVGVGEILAIYLIIRGVNVSVAVASAVVVSAATVWAGLPLHISLDTVTYEVLVFAAPAAVLGGWFASRLALWIGSRNLKLFFSVWIFFVGLMHFLP